jgi:hypothetical protein
MTSGSAFRVTDPGAPRRVADRGVGDMAQAVCEDVKSRTPVITGTLRDGWVTAHGPEEGTWEVTNSVPYARFVEYGTVNMAAEPMLGPVLAEARAAMIA